MSHPLRLRILRVLDDGAASPVELSRMLNERLPNVAYHVRILNDLGVIELARTAPRRGATEHWYQLTGPAEIPDALWDQLPARLQTDAGPEPNRQHDRGPARVASTDSRHRRAPAAPTHVNRVELALDPRGWREVTHALDRALREIADIQRRANNRNNEEANTSPGTLATVILPAPATADRRNGDRQPAKPLAPWAQLGAPRAP